MAREYSCAVIIGRFQPLHNSHKELIEQGLRIADKVLVLVGSSHTPRTIKNPFTFGERKWMIEEVFAEHRGRLYVEPIRDFFYSDDVWLANVQAACANHIEDGESVALLGLYKDHSSYYLNLFPNWDYLKPGYRIDPNLDATEVRDVLFNVGYLSRKMDNNDGPTALIADSILQAQQEFFKRHLPLVVVGCLTGFQDRDVYYDLVEEYYSTEKYKQSWANSPFPPTFVTADAVVTCSGHVLVVRRGGNPGKGLLALPGGFIREKEKIKDAAVRELKEETRIKVDRPILESSIVDNEVFDYPERSLRGRTITHAFHFKLKNGRLPDVKGSDDATGAFWLPFIEVMQRADEFFEDHVSIISRFINN